MILTVCRLGRPTSNCWTAPFCSPRQVAKAAVATQQSRSSSSGASSSSSQEEVAAVLASADLDPEELQQRRPDDYSRLTLPLAQVLAEVHVARVARAVGTLKLQPAELMARVCFLAQEVELTPGDLRHMLQCSLTFVLFDLESARDLLIWLQAQKVSRRQLQQASRGYPKLWAMSVERMKRSKQHLQKQLPVTDRQWADVLGSQARGASPAPEVFDDVVAWLESEPLEFSKKDIVQLWRSSPQVLTTPVATLQRSLRELLSRCPLSHQQLRQILLHQGRWLLHDHEGLMAKLDSLIAELPSLEPGLGRLLALSGGALALDSEGLASKLSCLQHYGEWGSCQSC